MTELTGDIEDAGEDALRLALPGAVPGDDEPVGRHPVNRGALLVSQDGRVDAELARQGSPVRGEDAREDPRAAADPGGLPRLTQATTNRPPSSAATTASPRTPLPAVLTAISPPRGDPSAPMRCATIREPLASVVAQTVMTVPEPVTSIERSPSVGEAADCRRAVAFTSVSVPSKLLVSRQRSSSGRDLGREPRQGAWPDADGDRHGSAMRGDAWKVSRRGTWCELLDVDLVRMASEPPRWRSTR